VALQLNLFPSPPGDERCRAGPAAGAPPLAAGPGVVVTGGALAAEAWLLARVDELAEAARREPARLALPVRVVVPSRSLRRHVAARLVRSRPGQGLPVRRPPQAVAGVAVQTLHGLACEVLERAGEAAPRGALLFETLVEREARAEPVLRRGLGELVDGFLAVAPAVADLLDAGLEPEHAEAVDEALAGDGPQAASRAEVERARALVRVAVETELRFRELGLGRHSTLLRQAAEAVAAAPERVLPARAVLLHGFVAASGVAADLLVALLRHHGATLLLDRPPVPGAAEGNEAAATARLAERAAVAAAQPSAPWKAPVAAPAARLAAFTAVGAEAEARQVACRLRRLLDGCAPPAAGADGERPAPESLAVVARDLASYRLALRRHLRRLGVPFSGVGERGGLLPAGRRAAAALDLLRWGPDAPADRWLDACEWMAPGLRVDLRLALRALGAARLRDVAALRGQTFPGGVAFRQGLAIAAPPARQAPGAPPAGADAVTAEGISGDQAERGAREPEGETAEGETADRETAEGEAAEGTTAEGAMDGVGLGAEPPPDEDGEGREVARARRISGRRLRRGVLAAARIHDRLESWPRQAPASVLIDCLRDLFAELGQGGDPDQPLAAAVAELQREVPGELVLGGEELRPLLARALGDGGQCALGGDGGGVQVLTVAEARGRTFDHLFLLGLNRAVMPRPVREDPLLPDDLRQVLQRVLPDLPLARDGFDDERHAFAQLLSAAPAACLSWQVADDDGKPLSASPLVERLLPGLEPRPSPALFGSPSPGAGGGDGQAGEWQAAGEVARPADEHGVLAGLYGSRLDFARVLPIAVAQVRSELGRPLLDLDPAAVAAARMRVLDEQDPDLRTAEGRAVAARLGPYFGFVGPARQRGGHPLYVTHLEALAACPWQLFVGRLLRVERPPDPLGALPGADPLRLGNLVHRALDRIVKRALAASGGAAAVTVAVGWPAAEELAALLQEAAVEVLSAEGLDLPGLARALASHALPFAEAARDFDWPEPGATVAVAASEVEGELVLEGGEGERRGLPRRLRFRADREDVVDGHRRFTDYKTGKPLSEARDAWKRRRQLLGEIRAGKRLQVVAYLLAAGGERALGRYLFLRPDLPRDAREVALEARDREARAAFAAAVRALLSAWDAGSFFPRLVDPAGRQEPPRCSLCTVAEACLRGDSGARRRLHQWAARSAAATPPERAATSAEQAAAWPEWAATLAEGAAAPTERAATPPEKAATPAKREAALEDGAASLAGAATPAERTAEAALLAVWELPAAVAEVAVEEAATARQLDEAEEVEA
jgi:hypothetical protein